MPDSWANGCPHATDAMAMAANIVNNLFINSLFILNASKLSFRSLNHDHTAILDIEALAGTIYSLALEVVIDVGRLNIEN